MNDLLIC